MAVDQNEGQSGQQNGPVDSLNRIFSNAGRLRGRASKKTTDIEKDTKKALSWIKRLGSGGWALWAILFLALATFGLALFGGGGAVTGTEDQGDAPVQEENIPGVNIEACEAPASVPNWTTYNVKVCITFNTGESEGRALESLKIIITANSVISISGIPKQCSIQTNPTLTEYTCLVSASEILALFTQVEGSAPPVYKSTFNIGVTPLDINTYGTITFTIE